MLEMWGKQQKTPHSFLYQKFGKTKERAFGVKDPRKTSVFKRYWYYGEQATH